jgi:acetyl esterase/lipase
MATKLRAAGVPTQASVYRGASHSFLEAVSIAAISDLALEDTAAETRPSATLSTAHLAEKNSMRTGATTSALAL